MRARGTVLAVALVVAMGVWVELALSPSA